MKLNKTLLSWVLFLTAVFAVQSQIKEGTIIYEMKLEGIPAEQAAMLGNMETRITFKGEKSLTELSSLVFSQKIAVTPEGMTMLMDQMGNKIAMKQTKAELDKAAQENKENQAEPKITYSDQTKTIAGQVCKKATITTLDENKNEKQLEVWYSDKFANPNKGNNEQDITRGLKGLPFEFASTMGPMTIKMNAKSVSTTAVDDAVFVLSTEGYQVLSAEEINAMSGK